MTTYEITVDLVLAACSVIAGLRARGGNADCFLWAIACIVLIYLY